jgi:diguanylate cyclase (GGDEF)-like protein
VAKYAMPSPDSRLYSLVAENERLKLALTEAGQRILALEKPAREDGLTGLLNRRSFDLELQRALDFHVRYGEGMALVLLDFDDFKGINDRYGHAGGDATLRHVAKTLTQSVRGSDIVARIGGDEFALILRHVTADTGHHKIELLRRALAAQPPVIGGQKVAVSLSAGCAHLSDKNGSIEKWFAEADANLYADKLDGQLSQP